MITHHTSFLLNAFHQIIEKENVRVLKKKEVVKILRGKWMML